MNNENQNNMNNETNMNTGAPTLTEALTSTPTPANNPIPPVVNSPIVENPFPNQNATVSQIPPVENINLQPEGIVTQIPTNEPVVNNTVEPLMGTSLNEQTVLNPVNPADNTVPNNPNMGVTNTNQMNMGMSNMGGIPPQSPNNIGIMGGIPVPPTIPENNPKPKKKMNSTLLIILIVVLILAVGFGIYYFLTTSKKKTPAITITPLLKEVELGSEILKEDYATVTGMNIANCTVDSNLNPKETGAYEYTVTCGTKKSEVTKVIVKDTTSPKVVLKDVIVTPNSEVKSEDFIEEIIDASTCTTEFVTEPDTSTNGEFEVNILVTDAYGNEENVKGKLIVDSNAPQYYLTCKEEETSTNYPDTTITKTYKYGINELGEKYNVQKTVTYKFEKIEDFETALEDISKDTFDGLKGTVKSEEDNLSITVKTRMEDKDLETEFNTSPFPSTETEIEILHSQKGECYIENN